MDGERNTKRAKFTVRSMSVSCHLFCPRRDEEREETSGRRRIIPSADSFLFISHS